MYKNSLQPTIYKAWLLSFTCTNVQPDLQIHGPNFTRHLIAPFKSGGLFLNLYTIIIIILRPTNNNNNYAPLYKTTFSIILITHM